MSQPFGLTAAPRSLAGRQTHYTLAMDDRHVIDLGWETELVECGEHSFVALQLTMDGIPAGDLCIVPLDEFENLEVD